MQYPTHRLQNKGKGLALYAFKFCTHQLHLFSLGKLKNNTVGLTAGNRNWLPQINRRQFWLLEYFHGVTRQHCPCTSLQGASCWYTAPLVFTVFLEDCEIVLNCIHILITPLYQRGVLRVKVTHGSCTASMRLYVPCLPPMEIFIYPIYLCRYIYKISWIIHICYICKNSSAVIRRIGGKGCHKTSHFPHK